MSSRKITNKEAGITEVLVLSEKISLTKSSIDKVIYNIRKNNYLQILYDYKEIVLKELLTYFEEIEDYEECIKIRDVVINHKQATGDRIEVKT